MMSRRVALRSSLRITLALLIGIALLPAPCVSMLVSAMGQGRSPRTEPPPRPGKPEGAFPDLDDVKNQSSIEREPPTPIPLTIRSQRNSGKPWDGRRVGDPPPRDSDQAGARGQTLRSHARRRMRVLPLVYEDQFIQNFFNVALARSATNEETLYWNYQLRAGYNESAASLKFSVGQRLGLKLGTRKPTEKDPGGRDIYNANGFEDLLFQACQIRNVRGIR